MHSEIPPHEKIRFHRSDIASLDSLPSAIVLPRPARFSAVSRRVARIVLFCVLGVSILVGVLLALVVAGLGDGQLRHEAQKIMAAMAGKDQHVIVGAVGVSLDGFSGLALEIDNLTIAPQGVENEQNGETRIGSARIGLDILPLLGGQIRPRSLKVSDASVVLASLPKGQGNLALAIFDSAGLVDPDLVAAVIFDGVRHLAGGLGAHGVRRINVSNLALVWQQQGPHGQETGTVIISEATLRHRSNGGLRLNAALDVFGRKISLRGQAMLDPVAGLVSELGLYIDMAENEAAVAEQENLLSRLGAATLLLSGEEGTREESAGEEGAADIERLTLSGRFKNADISISKRERDRFIADVEIAATARTGTGKIEIERLRIASGRSRWAFHGAFGPIPHSDDQTGEAAAYRYELVSDGSAISPEGSPEPTIAVTARIAGRLSADAKLLDVNEIRLHSGQGSLTGNAMMHFEAGATPGLDLRIDAGEFPVSHAKQLWPWFAAHGARNWVMSNLFGGHVEGGWVELSVPPGRLGNGVPLGREDVSGYFAIRGARFDVAGRIPPVRDGYGNISFFGSDVDIGLEEGTVYLPSGRMVAASDGRLTIREAHIRPVIGRLDIEVAGEADAVLELASYEPIEVSRFIDLQPGELSGKVSGNVTADIPLHSGIAPASLNWKVALSYEDLALARAFEGQNVANAHGTIVVDPKEAVIEAKARLNDLPASLHLVEPLGQNGGKRQRSITVEMDDRARNLIAPGLDTILSGVARVKVDEAGDNGRSVEIDLKAASLSLPWIGWSKGAGVPASASFKMAMIGERTELNNFSLSGETFAAGGAVTLRNGGVERVRFPSMRLNRGDDFSVDVERRRVGYVVTLRGKSLDARSAIKLFSRDLAEPSATAGEVPISVDLAVDALVGFHGEILHNVKLTYAGAGSLIDKASFSAVTSQGAQITYSDGLNGAVRNVSMHSADAGALLRFLDVYERMSQGNLTLGLAGPASGGLQGQVDIRDFFLVDEPRLSSIVSSPSAQDGRSLNQAVRGSIDTSRVHFERGYAQIAKTPGALSLERGILRGPLIGVSFQGTLYNSAGNMAMTGTFMPAYGLNRIFGEIPLIGQILGNGRDRGLIGITFRLAGKASEPKLEINPLSVIAPGIFRSVFEFR